jgi:antitoxin component HigA of HigAB toxin-antitoxin module
MIPKAIHNATEHHAAMGELRRLAAAPEGSEDAALFETWAILIDAYEASTIGRSDVDPVDIIKAHMDMMSLSRGDFAKIVGQNRATEILSHQRALTLGMIRDISKAWGISLELLAPAYSVKKDKAENQAHA